MREDDRTERSIRLLIAEDDDLFATLIEAISTADPRIEIVGRARDGREAVEEARRLSPDVIVMDIGMPLLDGLEATALIRARTPATQVVIFTASESERDQRRAREVGAVAYVLKTHIHAVLLAAIRRAAERDAEAAMVTQTTASLVAVAAPR